jgi:hypothetical protein
MLKKLIYYTTLFNSCQEKGFIIMDDDLVILVQAVIEAVKECTDASMLELVLELLLR